MPHSTFDRNNLGRGSLARLGKIDSGLLLWIISLAVLSLVFGLLALSRHSDMVAFREGDPEDPLQNPNNALQAVMAHNAGRRAEIAVVQQRIEAQEAYTRKLDFALVGLDAYWSDQAQHNGWLVGGDNLKTQWKMTEETIAQRARRLQAWSEAHRRPETQRFDELDALINKFQVDQQQVLTRAADLQARFETDREALILELDRFAAERREVDSKQNLDKSTLETVKLGLDAKIRELLDLRLEWFEECESFATVQRVDLNGRFMILNKGSGDGVLPGLRFEIFTIKQGKYLVKGMVEVVEIGEHIAKCRILNQVDPRNLPFHPGDDAGNPVFSPDSPKVFVFAGEFKLYNRSDLEDFVRALGGKIRPEIGPGVDFLIAGDRSEGVQDKAREFRLQAMSEDTLVRFLSTTFKPR